MKYFVALILLLCFYLSEAQIDSLATDSLVIQNDSVKLFPTGIGEYGIYYESIIKNVQGPEGKTGLKQQSIGICYKRLNLGIFKTSYEDGYEQIVIFPNQFKLNYTYGGGYAGIHFYRGKILEGTFLMNVGRGDMIWKFASSGEAIFRDEFMVYEPELHFTLVPIKYVKLFLFIGYRTIGDLNLSGVSASQFDGASFGAGLRIGLYK